MAKAILIGEVEDTAKWEESFRTHGDLFRSQTTTKLLFGVGEGNLVGLYLEIDNLDTWLAVLESPATHEAMALDGVKRDTVQLVVLDKEIDGL